MRNDEEGELHHLNQTDLQRGDMVSSEEGQKGFESETESKGRGKEPPTA
jgi:hypothetical protein